MNLGFPRVQIRPVHPSCFSSSIVANALYLLAYDTLRRTDVIHCTYIDRIRHDKLSILEIDAELRVMFSERQGMPANIASDINNQRALRMAFPVVPYNFQISKVRWRCAMMRRRARHRMTKPSMMASAGDAFFKPFMTTPIKRDAVCCLEARAGSTYFP